MDVLGLPPGLAPGGKQTNLGIGARPIAQAPIDAVRFGGQLDPGESNGLKGEAPRPDHVQRLREHGASGPQEQNTVFSGQPRYGQGLDVLQRHSGVVPLGHALPFPVLITPGRVGINHTVFSYKPNISFTIRLAPRTRPVRISILKMSCPMYCHAIVTAGRLLSTAGALLDRNAE